MGGDGAGRMRRAVGGRIACCTLLAVLAGGSGAGAQEATPGAGVIAVDPTQCTIAPRPADELVALARAGLPRVVAGLQEASADRASPSPEGTPPVGTPQAGTVKRGDAADAATVAAVTEVVGQYAACVTGGRLPELSAVLTERGAETFLPFSVLGYLQGATRGAATPTADVDPALLDAWAAAIAFPVPTLPQARIASYEVREVRRLEDGRVVARVAFAVGEEEPSEDLVVLREEGGRYRIEFGRDSAEGEEGTPVAATPTT